MGITTTVFMLKKHKIQFTQGNSKIVVILNNAHQIFRRARCRNFTRACISYGNTYPISARKFAINFGNLNDSNTAQARLVFIFSLAFY